MKLQLVATLAIFACVVVLVIQLVKIIETKTNRNLTNYFNF